MTVHFQVAEMASGPYWPLAFLRWSLVAIFVWFGIQKFTAYAAEAIEPLIKSSPFVSWLGVFGVRGEAKIIGTIELTTAAILITARRSRLRLLWAPPWLAPRFS
jgi:reactive chlorine resistance protein C